MKIHTNAFGPNELYGCLPDGMAIERLTVQGSRSHKIGYTVYCSGSSPYKAGSGDYKAATYDQYGVWIQRLFALERDAKIGHYKDEDDFVRQTAGRGYPFEGTPINAVTTIRPDGTTYHHLPA